MNYTEAILSVNAASIAILLLLAFLLLAASKFKGVSGYAALVIILPTVPVYLYNMSRMLGWHTLSLFMFPISWSVNTALMPLFWVFTKANFDVNFKFGWKQALHFLPMLFFFLWGISLPKAEILAIIRYEMSGDDTILGDINSILVAVQVVVYFIAIFLYINRRKKTIGDSLSDPEWVKKEWIPKFLALFAVLFVTVMVCYSIWPRTDAWLIQILNVVAMSYLVYNSLAYPVVSMGQNEEPVEMKKSDMPVLSDEEMKAVCERANAYLTESRAYLRPDITIAIFSKEADIPQKTLSRSINLYLNQNFFDFINRERVEEAKRRLLSLETSGFSIDSIYSECGFRSRSSFFMVFKKIEGITPAAWLERERGRQ